MYKKLQDEMLLVLKNISIIFSILIFCSCKKVCNSDLPACELEPNSGPCEAALIKYYYDSNEDKCKEFIYGGCQGTVPFDTLEECLECECE